MGALEVLPEGDASPTALAERIRGQPGWLDRALAAHGAVRLRGFDVRAPADFERVALAMEPALQDRYLGTSPRVGLTRHVFTASELPGYYPIPQHCEMTFIAAPPRRIFFCCLAAPPKGGETPLVDMRKVAADMDPAVRARFEAGGIRIIRNYDGPASPRGRDLWKMKRWDEIFDTTERAAVEASCAEQGFVPTWRDQDRLRLVSEHPAFVPHPDDGRDVWFNHVQVFHLSAAPGEFKRIFKRRKTPLNLGMWAFSEAMVAFKRRSPSEDQSLHCTYRDGREIPDADMEHVRDLIWRHMHIEPWQVGDVVALDNRAVAHGRLPYPAGPRQVVVAWS